MNMFVSESENFNRVSLENKRKAAKKSADDSHYKSLIVENAELKNALKLAKSDIEDWVYSKGESPQSTKVISVIDGLIN